MINKEELLKARIKDGSLVDCDMSVCKWKDNGEVFQVEYLKPNQTASSQLRVRLTASGYGGTPYGNGSIYAYEKDLIPVNTPMPVTLLSKEEEAIRADERVKICQELETATWVSPSHTIGSITSFIRRQALKEANNQQGGESVRMVPMPR